MAQTKLFLSGKGRFRPVHEGKDMLKENVGTIDRVVRVGLGLALILGYFLNPDGAYSWAYWLGIIPLATGLVKSCPIYSVLGLSTCPMKK
jgi:hypothetical protein